MADLAIEVDIDRSQSDLPITDFVGFVTRLKLEDQNSVLREFRDWAKALPR